MVIDSTHAYRLLWRCFRVLAPSYFGTRSRAVYVYMVLLHVLITALFPIHLLLGMLLLEMTPEKIFQTLTMTILSLACSLKHFVQIYRLSDMLKIQTLLEQLDKCVQSDEEHHYYNNTLQLQINRMTRCIYSSYIIVYGVSIPIIILALLTEPRELLYEGYVPFDWQQGGFPYYFMFIYQYVCLLVKGSVGLTNDIYTPLTLCNISGHMHLFGIRMARLGYQKIAETQTNQQLRLYFENYKLLTRIDRLSRKIISPVQFIQILSCGTNMCIIVCYVTFFVRETTAIVFNLMLLSVVCLQLFPSCYFASVLAEQAEQLPYAVFSGNWCEQSRWYRHNVLIFTQLTLSLADRPMMAGGLIPINLNTFFATVKMAYSLFAVVGRVN